MPGLRVFRCLRPPFIHEVRIGPSLAEDSARRRARAHGHPPRVARTLRRRPFARGRRHSSAFCWRRVLRVPHLYDMHSSLPQQLTNFAFTRSRLLTRAFAWMERFVIRRSRVVIVICPQLERHGPRDRQRRAGGADRERAGIGRYARPTDRAIRCGRHLGLPPRRADGPVHRNVRGLSGARTALRRRAHRVVKARPDARFVLAGGRPDQIARARADAAARGVSSHVVFAGQRPAEEIPAYLDAADVLVSRRAAAGRTRR